jgi:hypothetical protein
MADGGIVVPLGTAQFPVQLSNKTIYYDLVIADVSHSEFYQVGSSH